ncbi:MAG: hypothetical protein HYX72_03300 [Acidobacteria bacterium]|nr:hypothetical protein [Acidobacteriota bacterium]
MADLVYLSLWLRDYNADNMLQHWSRVLEAFPGSALLPGIRSISVYPLNWAESPVFERSFGEGATVEDAVILGSEFLHDDYAYEAEMNWDLWVRNEPAISADVGESDRDEAEELGWRLAPMRVSLACLGPQFESDDPEDHADIEINFGLDSPFIPPDPEAAKEDLDFDPAEAQVRTRENLQQMVAFVHRLDQTMPIKKRLLWCDSGENLADKIMRGVSENSDE